MEESNAKGQAKGNRTDLQTFMWNMYDEENIRKQKEKYAKWSSEILYKYLH